MKNAESTMTAFYNNMSNQLNAINFSTINFLQPLVIHYSLFSL